MARKPPMNAETVQEVFRLRAEGKTIQEIASITGYSDSAVGWRLSPQAQEKTRLQSRARYSRNRQSHLRACKEWQERHPEKMREYKRAWEARNPQKVRQNQQRQAERNRRSSAAWKRENPLGVAHQTAKRRAAKRGALSDNHTPAQLKQHLDFWQGRCAYCFCDVARPHVDHVVPLAKGGAHALQNLVPACQTCNLSKGAKTLQEWL